MDAILLLGSALGGALLGAFLGGRAVAGASARQAAREQAAGEARTLLNLFQALEAELSQVWELYQQLVGQDLERAGELEEIPFAGLFAASQRYFSVYDASARLLGALDPASGQQLIATFVHFKAYLEEWQALQFLSDKHRQVRLQANVNLYESRSVREEVERYLEYLKKRHFQVKGLVLASRERLREFLGHARQSQATVTIKL